MHCWNRSGDKNKCHFEYQVLNVQVSIAQLMMFHIPIFEIWLLSQLTENPISVFDFQGL